MNYDDFIDRVNDKVRTDDEWPESASVTQEQVDLSYLAAIAVASVMPLSAFRAADFTNDVLTGAVSVRDGLDKYVIPSTVFRYRNDLGINSITIDDLEYQLGETQTVLGIRQKQRNALFKGGVMFAVDLKDRLFYVLNGQSVKLSHLTEYEKPAIADIGTTEYPLFGTHSEQAASVVAMHVLGELKRDPVAAQFQALMQQNYDTHFVREASAETADE